MLYHNDIFMHWQWGQYELYCTQQHHLSKINYAAAANRKYVIFDNYSPCDGQNKHRNRCTENILPAQKLFYDYEKKYSFILAYCTMSCKLSNEAKCIYMSFSKHRGLYIRTKTLKRGILYFSFNVPLFLQMFFFYTSPCASSKIRGNKPIKLTNISIFLVMSRHWKP